MSLESNKDIAQSLARLDESRVLRAYRPFSWFPTVTAEGSGERSKTSNNDPMAFDGPSVRENYELGMDASWEIDLFGSLRRQFHVIDRNYQASVANLAAVRLAVVAEVAQSYFSLRGLQAQLQVQQRNLENLEESVRIFEARLAAGRGSALEIAQTRALAARVRAGLPETEAAIDRQIHRLATLSAQSIETLHARLDSAAPLPAMPELVAVGSPEEWLRRRPDVAEAERRLAAATAQIGVEMAEFYPKLNLAGGFGWTSGTAGSLIGGDSQRWRWGPILSWRFLDFGRVRLQVKGAEARADAALALFEQTVLRALEDTENAFTDLRALSEQLAALDDAVAQSREALRIARLRFDQGASDWLQVLDAERSALEIEDAHARATTARAVALTSVYKVLAGDFAERVDPGA
jgi:multidrug efflux system outer membrane protein